MKKQVFLALLALIMSMGLSSCATVLGGPVTACQRTKPAPGQPARQVRAVALIADVLIFLPFAAIDFATGAIYKPCDSVPTSSKAPKSKSI